MLDKRDELQLDYFSNCVSSELYSLVVGEHLGSGHSREVFEWRLDLSKVIKIETRRNVFSNVREWRIWKDYKNKPRFAKWLAPCHSISDNGCIMVQEKTSLVPENFKWPKKLPHFLGDTHKANFGLLKGQLVCHDYAAVNFSLESSLVSVTWE